MAGRHRRRRRRDEPQRRQCGAENPRRAAARALLLLVSHNPGRLLPTIRSRCRRVDLTPLTLTLASRTAPPPPPALAAAEATALAALSGGSIGRALELADAGGLDLYRALIELLAQTPAIDIGRLHSFADRLARADADDAYRAGEELLSQFLARLAAAAARGQGGGARTLSPARAPSCGAWPARADPAVAGPALRGAIDRSFAAARELNLDRKQTMLDAFFAIEELAR